MKMTLTLISICIAGLFVASRVIAAKVEESFPPVGSFAEVAGGRLHYAEIPASDPSLPPVVFIHGASGNLRDLKAPLDGKLRRHGRLIFVDRPGHGYSERGKNDAISLPAHQAARIAELLNLIEAEPAVIVGHSLGGSVAAAFALNHSDQAAGLVFLAPATHPWPGGEVTWYYHLTTIPVVGWAFSELLAAPAGYLQYRIALKGVFEPNRVPSDYPERSGTRLVLRPHVFRHNADDVTSLYDAVRNMSKRYHEINLPTSIITGDSDRVVLAEIHSKGLEKDISGAKLIWLENTGHMPAWTDASLVADEILRISEIAAFGKGVVDRVAQSAPTRSSGG